MKLHECHIKTPFKYEVTIDDSLAFTCVVFGWIVPDDNDIYKIYKRSIHGVSKLLTH